MYGIRENSSETFGEKCDGGLRWRNTNKDGEEGEILEDI